ncbi:MAG: M20 family metallopeptidase [Desulfosarcina sp.]|nr:M20 family metallopeptidase [Desulfosarcina sp.]MBC2744305.1 M20 family metallopeptidase [Desulfosarcina sp.]MBC2767214.1 M20 family metallopeptidase [Desulfosarcina sp.]
MDRVKESINRVIDGLTDKITAISRYLLENPETAYQEYKACEYLSRVLEKHDFEVEQGVGGVETAFFARPKDRGPGRTTVALLAEYDALPKIGHGCGHNLIAAASLGAAIGLQSALSDSAGGFVVVGTPAEEGGGGKVRLIEAGVFNGINAAMMFHPSQQNIPGKDMLGRIKFKMEFHGRTSHASNSPDKGINALDALVLAFTNINALRQGLRSDGRIHGIITHGGDAPNIIPDYAAGLFYVRGASIRYRDEIFDKVVRCAQAAAMAVGAKVNIEIDGPKIDPFKHNPALQSAFTKNMELFDIAVDTDNGRRGSSDIGNLSHFLPAIHPFLSILDGGIAGHSTEFRDATDTDKGRATLLAAAKLLAMTAYDFLNSTRLQEQVAMDFRKE